MDPFALHLHAIRYSIYWPSSAEDRHKLLARTLGSSNARITVAASARATTSTSRSWTAGEVVPDLDENSRVNVPSAIRLCGGTP